MTAILGISAFYHDSAAALLVDGEIVAAAQEERFTRKKHDDECPVRAIQYCLDQAGLTADQLDLVGFYDKPILKFERLLETHLAFAPTGFRAFARAIPVWLRQKLHLPRELDQGLGKAYAKRYVFTEHHESHAASAFFPSPFEEAAILTLDGVGEWATASVGVGRGNRIELLQELRFPHSLGLLYSAFTSYLGFRINDGEYKVMGLAPYGEPRHTDVILEELLDLKEDGSFRVDLSYFRYCQGLTMTSRKFHDRFGGPPRREDSALEQRHMDVAASIQRATEEIMLRMARHVHRETGMDRLCLAGGVALNCVGNGRLLREGPFQELWIQPAAGDAGGALGTAWFLWHQLLKHPRTPAPGDRQQGSFLGPAFDDAAIGSFLATTGATYHRMPGDEELIAEVVEALAAGKVVGWFQGRLEFGPRALGARSILADARQAGMQSLINQKVKFREGFRPFAPIVLREQAPEYFDLREGQESPYMLVVAPVRDSRRLAAGEEDRDLRGFAKLRVPRSVIPAVTHVDHSARIQTVDAERHGKLHRLLEAFFATTGCPVLVNTSFNLGWDPIVATPKEAFDTFMSSGIDVLCMGRFLLKKAEQRAPRPAALPAARPAPGDVLAGRLECPACRGEMSDTAAGWTCRSCSRSFPADGNIARLFWPHESIQEGGDVTEIVKQFYEETPFPSYDEHESLRSLIDKSRRGRYARFLAQSIPFNTSVLEVGCGTGQLTNFLGIGCREVIGTDMCLNSLRLGEEFRQRHGLERVRFVQMNLFRPAFLEGQFDVILCNGVLHHTSDPERGFRSLLPLLRPGGHLVVGLYNTYGRLLTDLRRQVFRLTGGRARWIDPILRRGLGADKSRAGFSDQYRHPHESKHTFDEVLDWFDRARIEFVRGVPALRPEDDGLGGASLFEAQPRGSRLERLLVQGSQVLGAGQKEGGLFLMVGRRPGG